MVWAGGAECRAVLKHPLMPAGALLILPQMEAVNMGYPDGAAWMHHVHPSQNSSFDSSLFMHFSLTFTLGEREARERVGSTWQHLLFSLLHAKFLVPIIS